MISHPLLPKLRQLRLSAMALTLDVRATQAAERQLTPIEFLALLLDDELERRSQTRLARHFTQSGCDSQKTLAHFNFSAAPGINRTLVQELATCAFLARHENILICGPTGVGKSHLANAIACEALKRDRRVLSRSTQRLLADLHAARAGGSQPRLLARVLAADLLVLDDFGLLPLSPQAAQDLYQIISERYEHGSMIVTSNRAFEEWAEVFGDNLLASAALPALAQAGGPPHASCPHARHSRGQLPAANPHKGECQLPLSCATGSIAKSHFRTDSLTRKVAYIKAIMGGSMRAAIDNRYVMMCKVIEGHMTCPSRWSTCPRKETSFSHDLCQWIRQRFDRA